MTNMVPDTAACLTDVDIAALGHSLACVLRSGRVSQHQAQVLQGALGGLQYCRYCCRASDRDIGTKSGAHQNAVLRAVLESMSRSSVLSLPLTAY